MVEIREVKRLFNALPMSSLINTAHTHKSSFPSEAPLLFPPQLTNEANKNVFFPPLSGHNTKFALSFQA